MENCKPPFDNIVKTNQQINLNEKNVLVISDVEIAKIFKEYFDEIVPKLNIMKKECYIQKTGNIEDPVIIIIFIIINLFFVDVEIVTVPIN